METNRRTVSLGLAHRSHLWWLLAALALAVGGALVKPAAAQQPPADKILTPAQLQNVVGPIALYPDDLVGIVLPASTYPLQVVEAERFLEKRKQDPNLKPSQDWDDSVVALLNYPEVVHLLSDDLDWTWDLGTAVLNQRGDVLDAIQQFRTRARDAGNLATDTHQNVTTESDGSIAIAPANPQVIYVPYYEPERVIVYQPTPVYSYYPWAYPVYYYPYPEDYVFSTGFFWGVTSYFSIGWHSHLLHVHYWGHNDFPYFGWNYYSPYYVRNYINVNINVPRGGYVWEPRHRYGDRPNVPIVRGREGRVSDSRPPVPHIGPGYTSPDARYRQQNGAPAPTRSGGVANSTPQYRGAQNPRPPNAAAPRTPREGGNPTAGERPNRQGAQPPRWESYRPGTRPPQQNDSAQRFTNAPAPRVESGSSTATPRYRIPAAPQRQPQYERPVPQREYRSMNSVPRFAAPEARAAPPRAQSFAAQPGRSEVRGAPRAESYRSGGGGGAQHQGGGNGRGGGAGRGGERGGEGRSR